jgi:hypothetical protein
MNGDRKVKGKSVQHGQCGPLQSDTAAKTAWAPYKIFKHAESLKIAFVRLLCFVPTAGSRENIMEHSLCISFLTADGGKFAAYYFLILKLILRTDFTGLSLK